MSIAKQRPQGLIGQGKQKERMDLGCVKIDPNDLSFVTTARAGV